MRTILDVLEIANVDYNSVDTHVYREGFKEIIFPELLETDEFSNVKGARLIETPVYTNTPIDVIGHGGDVMDILTYNYDQQPKYVLEYRYNPKEDDLVFNEYVQIYDIRIIGREYKDKNLPYGIWLHPVSYDEMTFVPKNKLELIFDPATLHDIDALGLRDELVNKMFELIKSGESNIPYDPIILIRCSKESIKEITKKDKQNKTR